MSGLLKERMSVEMTQSNTFSPRGGKYFLSSGGGDGS